MTENDNPSPLELRVEELEEQVKVYAKTTDDLLRQVQLLSEAIAQFQIFGVMLLDHGASGEAARDRLYEIGRTLHSP